MQNIDFQPLWLSLRLGIMTTTILFVACLPLAWWISQPKSRLRVPVRALLNMPLVLPPSVLGFYLLLIFSPAGHFGHFLEHTFDIRLVFSFCGILIGSIIFSLPFMINPLTSGFESLPSSLTEAAYVQGKSRLQTLEMRHRLQDEITAAHNQFGLTTILISHDINEIKRLSKHVYRIDSGRITAAGEAEDVFISSELGVGLSFTGKITKINSNGTSREMTIVNGSTITRLTLSAQQTRTLKIGDHLHVSATAVNPILTKIGNCAKTNKENIVWEQLQVCNCHG